MAGNDNTRKVYFEILLHGKQHPVLQPDKVRISGTEDVADLRTAVHKAFESAWPKGFLPAQFKVYLNKACFAKNEPLRVNKILNEVLPPDDNGDDPIILDMITAEASSEFPLPFCA
jgi:hypothetical protein